MGIQAIYLSTVFAAGVLSSQPGKGCTVHVTVPAAGPTKSGTTEWIGRGEIICMLWMMQRIVEISHVTKDGSPSGWLP